MTNRDFYFFLDLEFYKLSRSHQFTGRNDEDVAFSWVKADIIKKLTPLKSAEKGQFWHDVSSSFDTSETIQILTDFL